MSTALYGIHKGYPKIILLFHVLIALLFEIDLSRTYVMCNDNIGHGTSENVTNYIVRSVLLFTDRSGRVKNPQFTGHHPKAMALVG